MLSTLSPNRENPMTSDTEPTALDTKAPDVQRVTCTLAINDQTQTFDIEPWTTLLDLLREHCQLTGTKKGCDHGQCGACTALADGQRINTCLALAVSYDGSSITTIEGLADGDTLHPMQQSFIDHDAFQCGYCTPGQICAAVGMMNEGHAHDAADIREAMSGNLCRCGAYPNIVQAILHVAQKNDRKGQP